MQLIKVNGRILDYNDYRKKLILIRSLARQALKEEMVKYGFATEGEKLYSKDLDIEIELKFRKKERLEWV